MGFALLRIWDEHPKTVVFITHSISEAVLSDRIIVMTPRPGTVQEIISVPLPRPRSMVTLSQPIFQDISLFRTADLYPVFSRTINKKEEANLLKGVLLDFFACRGEAGRVALTE